MSKLPVPYTYPLVDNKGELTLPWKSWVNRVNAAIFSDNAMRSINWFGRTSLRTLTQAPVSSHIINARTFFLSSF
jgi:hypothetical protein